jgi:tripartite-type tricarboxylate transporter receptor subunit TctC
MDRRRFLSSLAASSAAVALPSMAAGGTLPTAPIKIVVGFPAGGGTDVLARIVGTRLNAIWGVPVIVENKTGAAGLIAAAMVAKAPADGTTLMMGHINALGIAPGLYPKMQFSAENDFAPIAMIGQTPQVLIAYPGHAAASLAKLVEHCKKNAGKVSFGSSGIGSAQHLALALFEQAAGIDALHVPFKGAAPLMNDLMGGQIDYAFEGMTTAAPFIKSSKVKVLAQTGLKRAAALADVPTVAELGFPGFNASIWFGLVGPAGMPPAMVAQMNADVTSTPGAMRSALGRDRLFLDERCGRVRAWHRLAVGALRRIPDADRRRAHGVLQRRSRDPSSDRRECAERPRVRVARQHVAGQRGRRWWRICFSRTEISRSEPHTVVTRRWVCPSFTLAKSYRCSTSPAEQGSSPSSHGSNNCLTTETAHDRTDSSSNARNGSGTRHHGAPIPSDRPVAIAVDAAAR